MARARRGGRPAAAATVAANVFTDPEIATVGVQEKSLPDDAGLDVVRCRWPPTPAPRWATSRRLRQAVRPPGTGIVLGGVVVAPGACELVLPIALAVSTP